MYFFQQLEEFIESIFSFIENSSNNQFVTELSILFSISIVLFIMLKGYMVLAGKSQDPIRELAWDILVKMLIITFALNLNGWCTAVTESMEAINSWAGGGVSLYAELDKLLDATVNLQNAISDRGNIVSSFFYGLIVYIAFLIGVIPTLFVVITTTFTLKILIMLAPIMFFVLFYGWLKNMFTQWLSLFLSNTLTILILGLILSSIINTLEIIKYF